MRNEQRNMRRSTLAVVLCLVLTLGVAASGCAAVDVIKPFASILIEHGIDKAEKLAAGGEEAIAKARAKAEAIPDQLDRIEALAEITRAEQIRQTLMIEYLVACHPPEMLGDGDNDNASQPSASGAADSTVKASGSPGRHRAVQPPAPEE